MSEFDESELIAAARAGDEHAFGALVAEHLPTMYRFCLRYTGSGADAEDAAQETFLKAWRSIKKFDPKRSFRTWLFAIAKNAATDLLRKRRSVPFSDLDFAESDTTFAENLPDPEPLPEQLFAQAEAGLEVARALEALSPRDRTVLSLRYEEGLSFEEIAMILKTPANTVRSLHRRALIKLREQFPNA